MGLPTEYSPTNPVTSTCQAECSAISRPQESLTIVQKQETGNKDRERLIARAKEIKFQPGHKLTTEEKKRLDPSQEVVKAIKAQWGKKDT